MPDVRDGAWQLVDFDPASQRSVWMTEQDGQYVFRVDMPLDDIFDANAEAEQATHGVRFGDYVRVASVPHHLFYQNGLNEAVEQHDDRFIAKVLNDADNRKFRTSRGRV